MGLLTGLLTLPLSPVRGVAWIAERVYDEANREFTDPAVIRQRLEEVQEARESGEITDEEATRLEEEFVRRLMDAGPPSDGLEV
jgi:cytochrome c-type biogenesis protein CcmI